MIDDKAYAELLLKLLREHPWPTSNPQWQAIEYWAADLIRRLTSPFAALHESKESK